MYAKLNSMKPKRQYRDSQGEDVVIQTARKRKQDNRRKVRNG
jgi:hypothetical protein